MTWALVLALGGISLGLRGVGFAFRGVTRLPATWDRRLHLGALALLGAVIATQTLARDGTVVVDARLAGLSTAVVCAATRRSVLTTFVAAVAVTAAVRAVV